MPSSFRDRLHQITQKHIAAAVDSATRDAFAAYRELVLGTIDGGRPRAPAKAPATTAATKGVRPKKPSRRSSSQITATLDRVLEYIGKHPGQNTEGIVKGMGGRKKAIKDALARLRDGKMVKTKGVKRGMTYTVGGTSQLPLRPWCSFPLATAFPQSPRQGAAFARDLARSCALLGL